MIRSVTRAGANASAFLVLCYPRIGLEIAHPAGMLRDRRKVPPRNKKMEMQLFPATRPIRLIPPPTHNPG